MVLFGRLIRGGIAQAKRVAVMLLAVVLLTTFIQVIEAAKAPEAKAANSACAATGYTDTTNKLKATPSHGQVMYIDSGVSPKVDAAYVGYKIQNTDTVNARTNLWVALDSFAGGKVTLANPSDAYQQIPSIPANGSATVFFLLKASGSATTAQTHTVHVYNKRPDLTSPSELLVCDFKFQKVLETIRASANKVNTVTSLAAPLTPTLGGTVEVSVTSADFGRVGSGTTSPDGTAFWASPTGFSTWPTRSLRLEKTSITIGCQFGSNITLTDQIFTNDAAFSSCVGNGSKSTWTGKYTYRIIGPGPATTKPTPVAFVASGTQFKHSDPSAVSGGNIDLSGVASSALVVTVSAAGTPVSSTATSVTVEYTVTVTTSSTTALKVDEIVDTHQAGTTFVPNSVRTGTNLASLSAAPDPAVLTSDQNLSPPPYHFVGPYSVSSASTFYIKYQFTIPCGTQATTYSTTVVAYTGDVLIGSSSTEASASAVSTTSTSGICTYSVDNTAISLDPSVTTQPYDTVTDSAANINAYSNAAGGSGVTFQFVWSRDPNMVNGVTQTGWVSISGSNPVLQSKALSGLAQLTTYYYQGQVKNSTGTVFKGGILNFTTSATPAAPTVTTTAASNVLASSVTLNGSINPNLTAVSGVSFQICETLTTTTSSNCKTDYPVLVDDGSGAATNLTFALNSAGNFVVSSDNIDGTVRVTGLTSGRQYFYRLYATCSTTVTSGGVTSANTYCPANVTSTTGRIDGAILAFTAGSPTAVTSDATAVGETQATLNGSANANGSTATVAFRYGTDPAQSAGLLTNYTSIVGSTANLPSSGNTSESATPTLLTPGTLYYFQIVVTTSTNTVSYGAILTFTTLKITTDTPLTSGRYGQAYTASFAGMGGSSGYNWTKTGSLPGGLSLATNGLLSGTPTAAGVFSITIVMTDITFNTSVTKVFSLTINAVLTYAGNGNSSGTEPAAVTGNGVVQLASVGTLAKTRYNFGGWNIGGTVYAAGADYTLTTDTTATAVWVGDVYTVTYSANTADSGTLARASDSFTVGTTSPIVLPNAGTMQKAGHTFGGWSATAGSNGAGGGAVLDPYTPQGSLTLYAIWTPIDYTITYNRNYDTTTTSNHTYQYGDVTALSFASTWSRTGYEFLGWNTSNTATTALTSYTVTENATLYAVWKIMTYTITYNKNDGSGTVANQDYNYGDTTALAYSSGWSRTGYDFGGWSATNTGTALGSHSVSKAEILYAVWNPKTYTITYDANTATGAPSKVSDSFTVGTTSPIALPDSTGMAKTGFTFMGWSENAGTNGSGTTAVANPYTPSGSITLYAMWTNLPVYTVTFKPNYLGPTDATQSSTVPTNLVANPFTTNTGYTFLGWATSQANADAGTVTYLDKVSYSFTADVDLYAVWQINQYKIIYDKNDGTVPSVTSEVSYDYNTTTALGFTPSPSWTRTGYHQIGWALTDGATDALSSFTVTEPVTLYAVWVVNTYTVTYNSNDGTNQTDPQTVAHGNISALNYSAPSAASPWTRTGYNFLGWNTDPKATTALTSYTVEGDVNLYAIWEQDIQLITYTKNDGSGDTLTDNQLHGSTTALNFVSGWTRTGYRLLGWNTDSAATTALGSYTVTGNVTLHAIWQIESYTITYDMNDGGTTQDTQTFDHFATNALDYRPNPVWTRTGYTFQGWNTDKLAVSKLTSYTVSGAVTLYAIWKIDNYTITYNKNDGTSNTTNRNYDYNATDALIPNPSWIREGYEFLGWNTSDTSTSALDSYTVTGTTTLNAVWKLKNYDITYDMNDGGTTTATENYDHFATNALAYTTNPEWTRNGYVFLGWNTDKLATIKLDSYTVQGVDTLYAIWSQDLRLVTFDKNDASGITDEKSLQVGGNALNSAPTWSRIGYDLVGWNTDDKATTKLDSYTVAAVATLYAIWQIKSYDIIYDMNDGSTTTATEKYDHFATNALDYTPNPVWTRTGYQFAGWNTSKLATSALTSYTVQAGATLYAIWRVDLKQITFDSNDGLGRTSPKNLQVGTNALTSAPTSWSRTGYELIGWNTDNSALVKLDGYTVSSPITIYAVWKIVAYTITFVKNDGSNTKTTNDYDYGSKDALNFASPWTLAGHRFLGWASTSNATTPALDYTVTEPDTLYAIWEVNKYTITFDKNDGSNPAVTKQQIYSYLSNAAYYSSGWTRDGYTFVGWNSDGTLLEALTSYEVEADSTLYAIWSQDPVIVVPQPAVVTFKPGSWYSGISIDYTQSSTTPAQLSENTFSRVGYRFGGWSLTDGGALYKANQAVYQFVDSKDFYAIWVPETYTVTFNYRGGSQGPLTITFTFGGPGLNLPTSSRSNYNFGGWCTAPTGSDPVDSPFIPNGNILLYAIWTPVPLVNPGAPLEPVKIIFHYNGGEEVIPEVTYMPGSAPVILPETELENYEFVGWTDKPGSTEPIGRTIAPASNVELFAIFVGETYEITLDSLQPGKKPIELEYTYGGAPVNLPVLSMKNYQFKGWSEELRTTKGEIKNFTCDGDVKLYPVWKAIPAATPVYFGGDSPSITKTAYSELVKLANKVKSNVQKLQVFVDGWVKETNDKSYDLKLAQARAVNTVKVLRALGIDAYVNLNPRGISPENSAKSRRTNITIFSSGPKAKDLPKR